MEPQLQFGVTLGPDLVRHDEDVGLEEHQMSDELLEAQSGGIRGGGIALHVVERFRGAHQRDRRSGLVPQRLAAAEPLRPLAHLAPAADQERVMLSGPLGPIAIVADQPRACAEEHEVVGVGMDVPATRVVRELTHGVMTQERPALEDDQRLIIRPVGSRRDDAHVLEMVERGQILRRVRGHGGIEPEQVQP